MTEDLAGQHWEAQAYYRDGLVRAPGDPALTVDLALSLALSGDYPNAIAVLQPLAMAPTASRQERQTLALIYGLNGNTAEAARHRPDRSRRRRGGAQPRLLPDTARTLA